LVTRVNSIAIPAGCIGRSGSGSRAQRTTPIPTSTGRSSARRSSNRTSVPTGFGTLLRRNSPARPTYGAKRSTNAVGSS